MKRLALISDIHGNYKALEAFLEYLTDHPVEGIIGLGDYVTDSPYPERTVELLHKMEKQYPCWLLRGNREEYLLDNPGNCKGWKPSSASGVLNYTLQRLTQEDLTYFASMPTERKLELEGYPTLYLCHGTPGQVRGNVSEEKGLLQKVLSELPCRYLMGGHSHRQEIQEHQGNTYINPGSLGLAVDGVGRKAQFAILTLVSYKEERQGCCTAELLSIDYDIDAFLEDFAESGLDALGMTLNKAVKKNLLTGVNFVLKCIRAMEAEAARTGWSSISDMPEEYWKPLEERFGL